MSHYVGIDIGTFEAKGVLVRSDGNVVATARHAHKMRVPQPSWAEHDADADWWAGFTSISQRLISDSGVAPADIRAVACSAIGPCMLPVDAHGAPLMNAVLYGVDTRAAAEIDELTAQIGEDRLLEVTGNPLTSQSVGPKILWLKRNRPEIWAKTARVLTATSYLVYRLTGENVIDHYSAAGFGPLYDTRALDWTEALAPGIITRDALPRLGWSADIAGQNSARAAGETGLAEGTPVTFGTIDAAAEALSVGVRGPGDTMVMYGSTVFVIGLTRERTSDARLWSAPWLFEDQHAAMAGLATSGTLTHWFRDELARELDPSVAFERLAAEAETVPAGAKGLIMLPYFSGERTPIHDPNAKGCLIGLNLTHTRGHIYRALLEGIACGTAHAFEAFAQAGAAPARLLAVGGGTKNRVWLQATSDISGLDQNLRVETIGASLGDAFLAALAMGEVSPGDIDAWNPQAGRITARPTPQYARHFDHYKRLYLQTRDIMVELSAGEPA
jgi:xylulokinase